MDFDSFIIEVDQYKRKHQAQRWGQAYMNVLFTVDRDLYGQVHNTLYDPFYSDAHLGTFLAHLAMNWGRANAKT